MNQNSGHSYSTICGTAACLRLGAILILVATSACMHDSSDGNDPGNTPNGSESSSNTSGNNSALMTGATIGSNTVDMGSLRKPIGIQIIGATTEYTVGSAYATRTSTSSDYAYVIFPITNIGTQTRCFIKLADMTYRNNNGDAILSGEFTYIRGSVGKVSQTTTTSTCLAPGETGMAGDIQSNLYAAVAKVEFSFGTTSPGTAPLTRVIPQSYAVKPITTLFQPLEITIKNTGSTPALVGERIRFHEWFVFDTAGIPATWALSDNTSPSVVLASGTATVIDDVLYDGAGTKLMVFVNFEDTATPAALNEESVVTPPTVAGCSAELTNDALMFCRAQRMKARIAVTRALHDAWVAEHPGAE